MSKPRVEWVDTCKALAMMLVFYGHLWLSSEFPSSVVATQNKLIYSFHMPLFFMLAGFFATVKEFSFKQYLTTKICSRLIPFLFFNLVSYVVIVLRDYIKGEYLFADGVSSFSSILFGRAPFNAVTWFLVCLFTVEIIHFFTLKKNRSDKHLLCELPLFYIVGYVLTWKMEGIARLTHLPVNFWYFNEAVFAYSFFLFGYVLNRSAHLQKVMSPSLRIYFFLVCSAVFLLTFQLNRKLDGSELLVPLMISGVHGHPIYFLVSAISGAFAMIALSNSLPRLAWLSFIGKNTLVLLGLNGIFRDFLNPLIVRLTLSPSSYQL